MFETANHNWIDGVIKFKTSIKEYLKNNGYSYNDQSDSAVMLYLSFKFPDKFYIYNPGVFEDASNYLKSKHRYKFTKKQSEKNLISYKRFCDEILSFVLESHELLEADEEFHPKHIFKDTNHHLLVQDIIFFIAWKNGSLFNSNVEKDIVSKITEGRKKQIYTYVYERNKKNREKAIKMNMNKNNGKLLCDVCAFDFEKIYGELGKGFIEVHHNKPLAQNNGVEVLVNPNEDLNCVCPNCHRMLHRLKIAPTVENLKNKMI